MRLLVSIKKLGINDCEKTIPVIYSDVQKFLNDFFDECSKARNQNQKTFSFANKSFDVEDHFRYVEAINDYVYFAPLVQTVDEFFHKCEIQGLM